MEGLGDIQNYEERRLKYAHHWQGVGLPVTLVPGQADTTFTSSHPSAPSRFIAGNDEEDVLS